MTSRRVRSISDSYLGLQKNDHSFVFVNGSTFYPYIKEAHGKSCNFSSMGLLGTPPHKQLLEGNLIHYCLHEIQAPRYTIYVTAMPVRINKTKVEILSN